MEAAVQEYPKKTTPKPAPVAEVSEEALDAVFEKRERKKEDERLTAEDRVLHTETWRFVRAEGHTTCDLGRGGARIKVDPADSLRLERGDRRPTKEQRALGEWELLTPEQAADVVTLQDFDEVGALQAAVRSPANIEDGFAQEIQKHRREDEDRARLLGVLIQKENEAAARREKAEAALAAHVAGRSPEWRDKVLAGRKPWAPPKRPLTEEGKAWAALEARSLSHGDCLAVIAKIKEGATFEGAVQAVAAVKTASIRGRS